MKTLDEIYNEVLANKELAAEFRALQSADEKAAFVKKLGGEATAEEIADFMDKQSHKTGELSDAELEQVVGGKQSADNCPKCGSDHLTISLTSDNHTYADCCNCGYRWSLDD